MKKLPLARKKVNMLPYLLLLPVILILGIFSFYPFLRSIYLTFFVTNNLGRAAKFVGFKNYVRVLTSDGFLNSIIATFKFAAIVGVGTFTIAFVFSLLSVQEVPGSKIYQTMFSIPMAIASAPLSALSMFILSKGGILNTLLGKDIAWLAQENTALWCVAAVTIWSGIGSSFIFLLVGFRNVPDDLVESATIDGANALTKIRNVYIPIASPQIFFVIFLNIIHSFKAFAVIRILVGKGPNDSTNILVYAVYANAFLRGRFETACVYSMVLCLIIFITTRIQMSMEKRWVYYQ